MKRGTARVKCLAQEHYAMCSVRAQTRTAQSGKPLYVLAKYSCKINYMINAISEGSLLSQICGNSVSARKIYSRAKVALEDLL